MIPLNTTLEVLPIEVIEEREQVEGELDPALPLAFVQRVRVHDARRVVEPGAAHHGPIHVPEGEKNLFNNSVLCQQKLGLPRVCQQNGHPVIIKLSSPSD